MTVSEVDEKLKSSAQNGSTNGWTESQMQGDKTYGLNLKKVKEIAYQVPNDPILADELYSGNNHDLKVLAALIDNAESYSCDELSKRSKQLYPSPFAEEFCHNIMAHSIHAIHFVNEWHGCADNNFRCYAYYTLAEMAAIKNNVSDTYYTQQLRSIASQISDEKDDVMRAMLAAFKAIARRNKKLERKALKEMKGMGKVVSADGSKINLKAELKNKSESPRAAVL
jgi:hypothetical protein